MALRVRTEKPQSIKTIKQPYKMIISQNPSTHFNIHLAFAGHYNESDLTLKVSMQELKDKGSIEYLMTFDVMKTGKWENVLMLDKNKEVFGLAEFVVEK